MLDGFQNVRILGSIYKLDVLSKTLNRYFREPDHMYETLTRTADIIPRSVLFVLGAIFVAGVFVVGFDQGQIVNVAFASMGVDPLVIHEFSHDLRHAAGFPCH